MVVKCITVYGSVKGPNLCEINLFTARDPSRGGPGGGVSWLGETELGFCSLIGCPVNRPGVLSHPVRSRPRPGGLVATPKVPTPSQTSEDAPGWTIGGDPSLG